MIDLIPTGKRVKGLTVYHNFDVRLTDGTPIGECNIRLGGDTFYTGNLGYRINEEYRNRGYATSAALKLTAFASELGAKELFICCAPTNLPSRRVAEKLGAVYLGDFKIPESHELYAYGVRTASRYSIKTE